MGRRSVGFLVAIAVTGGFLAPAGVAHGAVLAKKKKSPDPCALITNAAAGALADPFTVSSTDLNPALKTNCNYQLQATGANNGSGGPLNLFVEKLSFFTIDKALVHNIKKTKGLGVAGFIGVDGGGKPVLVFKTKKLVIRMTSDLDPAVLLTLAKGVAKKVK